MICIFFHCQNVANHDCDRDFCFFFKCLFVSFRFVCCVVVYPSDVSSDCPGQPLTCGER